MPLPFRGTHPKLDTAGQCLSGLQQAWEDYTEARVIYATALLGYNWTHRGGKQDENPQRRTEKMSTAYDNYFEKMDTFKGAHARYKTAIRELLRGHLL